jgi:hypothetical protein
VREIDIDALSGLLADTKDPTPAELRLNAQRIRLKLDLMRSSQSKKPTRRNSKSAIAARRKAKRNGAKASRKRNR